MSTEDLEKAAEVKSRVAQMKEQLARKSSLFDVLNPPTPKKQDKPACRDAELQGVLRRGRFSSVAMLVMVAVLLGLSIAERASSSNVTWLLVTVLLMSGLAQDAFSGIRLARERILSLEAELQKLRRQNSTSADSAADAPEVR